MAKVSEWQKISPKSVNGHNDEEDGDYDDGLFDKFNVFIETCGQSYKALYDHNLQL